MYSSKYGHRGHSIGAQRSRASISPSDPVGAAGPGCGLPAPMPAPPGTVGAMAGQRYCRSHLGDSVLLTPAGTAGATADIVLTPTNMVEFVCRWAHFTATSDGVSPVTFTQAFTITAISALGDNQLAAATPVIGSTWAAQQTYLEVFWDRVITANNPLRITVTNLDPALNIRVFGSIAGDGVKS